MVKYNELPRSRAVEVSKQRKLLMIYPLIFFFCSLCFHICLYGIFISMTTYRINVIALCPKLSTPKLPLYFWVKLENFFGCDAFYCLDYSCWTHHWDALYQKMNMIFIRSNLYEGYFISFRYFKTNLFQTLINSLRKYYPTIFCRAYKVVQQY